MGDAELIFRSCPDFVDGVADRQGFKTLTEMELIIVLARATIGNVPLSGVLITRGFAFQ